jgi:hypothetical protein
MLMITKSQVQSVLVSRNEAQRLLGICSFTLWKWAFTGVLKPLILDGQTAAYFRPEVEQAKADLQSGKIRLGRQKKAVPS